MRVSGTLYKLSELQLLVLFPTAGRRGDRVGEQTLTAETRGANGADGQGWTAGGKSVGVAPGRSRALGQSKSVESRGPVIGF